MRGCVKITVIVSNRSQSIIGAPLFYFCTFVQ